MSGVEIRGTTDPDTIAVVLAVLQRARAGTPPGAAGAAAWRARRRAALAGPVRVPRT